MLREYIETRYKMNKAMREELEKQIRTLQEEHQAAEEALKELQKDQDIEKSIFSPRSQLGGTPEKLAEIRTTLESGTLGPDEWEDLFSFYSDFYKDVFGHRPRDVVRPF